MAKRNQPIPPEQQDTDDGNPIDRSTDLLARAATKGPVWLRAIALVTLILTTITPYLQRFFEYLDDRQANDIAQSVNTPLQGANPYKGGTPVKAPSDAPALSANALSPEDAIHLSWHNATKMEKPNFKRLLVSGRKGIIAYSVYPSDGCILINHIQGSHLKSDLVRAEESSINPLKKGENADKSTVGVDWNRPELKLNVDWEIQTPLNVPQADKTPVQGSCMNPHPGQFSFWSVPVDQCIEQVFRRFGDGCTHYQAHNRCNNFWEPGVHWTFCNSQHAW